MGLDFTSINDKAGAAFYVLHGGNPIETERYQALKVELDKEPGVQCVVLDAKTSDGEKVRQFYGFSPTQLPVAFIVLDNDTLGAQWVGEREIPTNPGDIAFQLRQVG